MPLPQFLAETEAREEEVWESARGGLRELAALLEEKTEGPFFLGDVGELFSLFLFLGEEGEEEK